MRSTLKRFFSLAPTLIVGGVFVGFIGAYALTPFFVSHVLPASPSAKERATAAIEPFTPSTTTPVRVINRLTVLDAVPKTGKFIAADLKDMTLTLYENGVAVGTYPILTKGRPGSPYETPAGFYEVLTKETDHFNKSEQVHMPFSMQFYGNYFIHGWPYYEKDGTPVASTYSGGCIRLSTDDAGKVYAFAEKGTGVFVYDPAGPQPPTIVLGPASVPHVSAESYLVADIDTGDVYLEKNAREQRPIASLTKLMTALVANETIMFNKKISVASADLAHGEASGRPETESFVVGDLLYPLLMESNNAIADELARYYGTHNFVRWMNDAAKALDMQSTHFADASGVSASNVSVTDDLYRLAVYLANKKSFILGITRTPEKKLVAASGNVYPISNFNIFSGSPDFIGGKVGETGAAGETMASVFSVTVDGVSRRVAIVVLKSEDYTVDTTELADWFTQSARQGAALASAAACATCAAPTYRQIGL